MLNEMVCPECEGAQRLFDTACGCHLAHRSCLLCKGAGQISRMRLNTGAWNECRATPTAKWNTPRLRRRHPQRLRKQDCARAVGSGIELAKCSAHGRQTGRRAIKEKCHVVE